MTDKNVAKYINRTLLQQRNIKVQEDWLDACIQWLREEYNGENGLSESKYKDLVYEQWLMANLKEIGQASLPTDITETGKSCTKLFGKFMLQVNYAYNIGSSAYSQLQKIKGCDPIAQDEQPELFKPGNSFKENQTQYRGHSSRVLFLELTDGIVNIDAIEYNSIPALKGEIAPGCKVELIGPIECRKGILLLTTKNVRILGGNCEDLVKECTQSKIFKNLLSLPEENIRENSPVTRESIQPQIAESQRKTGEQTEVTHRVEGMNTTQASKFESGINESTSHENQTIQTNQNQARNLEEMADFFNDDFDLENECDESNHNQASDLLPRQNEQPNAILEDDLDMVNLDDEPEIQIEPVQQQIFPRGTEKDEESQTVFLVDIDSDKTSSNATVKAYVVTLLSKLEMNESGFKLDVCIDDGSAVCNASVSNRVLEEIVGYTASEILNITKRSLPLPDPIKQAIIRCQQKLATKIWIMNICVANYNKWIINGMKEL